MRLPNRDRRVRLYANGQWYALETQWNGDVHYGKERLRYLFYREQDDPDKPIFEGNDFGCSPCHAVDSDQAVYSLLNFLTLRLGDTDSEYFNTYTTEQIAYRDTEAEELQYACYERFPALIDY